MAPGRRRSARTCARSPTSRSPRTSAIPSPWCGTPRTRSRRRRSTATTPCTSPRPTGRNGPTQCCYEGPYRTPWCAPSSRSRRLTYEPDRRHRRRGHHLAARGARRQPQLGLPLLLAARRHAHPRVADARRLLRRGHGVARLAAARRGRRRLEVADHVRARRASAGWTSGRPTGSPATRARLPVRIGNAASDQYQLDVYGEVMSALYSSAQAEGVHSRVRLGPADPADRVPREGVAASPTTASGRCGARAGTSPTPRSWPGWPSTGPCARSRSGPTSTGPLEKWRALRDDIFTEVCEKGYNEKVGAFTQYYGSDQLDASVLMIPLVGFLPPSDQRVVSTVEAVAARPHGPRLRAALPHRPTTVRSTG